MLHIAVIEEVQVLLANGAQLMEVLPEGEYLDEHIAGAVNVPLKRFTDEGLAKLDRGRTTIVYCYDYQ